MPDTLHGFPPFQMKQDMAAYYCGMSVSSFVRAVKEGVFPEGRKKTGGTFWLRNELEQAMVDRNNGPKTDFSARI